MPKKKVTPHSSKTKRKRWRVYLVFFTINGFDADFRAHVFATSKHHARRQVRGLIRPESVELDDIMDCTYVNLVVPVDHCAAPYEQGPYDFRN